MARSGMDSRKDEGGLIAMIVDEDTSTGMLLTGLGHLDLRRQSSFLIVDEKTTQENIEEAFRDFTTRDDVAILLINQAIASSIRHLLDNYTRPVPAILEIPSKTEPYDPKQDSILSRVKFLFGE